MQVLPLSSGIVTVPQGSGITAGVALVRAISQMIPPGSRLMIRSMSISVLNGPANQILVSLGSVMPDASWSQKNAQSFQALGEVPVNLILNPPGPCFVDLSNITGTTYQGAQGAGVDLDVVVALDAVLQSEVAREQVQH